MSAWILDSLGPERLEGARTEVSRRLLREALATGSREGAITDQDLRFVADGLELAVLDAMDQEDGLDTMRRAAADAFAILRVIARPADPQDNATHCLRLACLAVLGERGADAERILRESPWRALPLTSDSWIERVLAAISDAWLRVLRKDGWRDLEEAQQRVLDLRRAQQEHEARYLATRNSSARTDAWELVCLYHLAKAAEILTIYTTQGEVDGGFDVREQLGGQFDRALTACERAELLELHTLTRLLRRTAAQMVDNSIWTVTRAVNSRVSRFVEEVVGHGRGQRHGRPIFEMLPPQRRTLASASITPDSPTKPRP